MKDGQIVAIMTIWIMPAIAIIVTKEVILGWVYLFAVFATEQIVNWKEDKRASIKTENIINDKNHIADVNKKFRELDQGAGYFVTKFDMMLDKYVFTDIKEESLTDDEKKWRHKLMKFCIDMYE